MTDAPRGEAPLDLLTRRRLETHHEIHLAALELFEVQGVRETTVAQIAARIGISSRTFFRYFSSKEQAGLPGQRRLLDAIDAIEITETDARAILRAVEAVTQIVIGRGGDPDLDEHRRIAKLLAREPELQAFAAAQERTLTVHLRGRLTEQLPDHDPLTLLLIAELAVAMWRAAWERWGELTAQGESVDPAEIHSRCRAELERIVG